MNLISLQPDLGIEHVADLQAALLPHLDDDTPLQLAGDKVERVHAAGLQQLHAFGRDRASAGRSPIGTLASQGRSNPGSASPARPSRPSRNRGPQRCTILRLSHAQGEASA